MPSRLAPAVSRPQAAGNPRNRTVTATATAAASLALTLRFAALVLAAVRQGTALPLALDARLASAPARGEAARQLRGAVQDIAYRTLRVLATVDALLALLVDKPLPRASHDLLSCATALLLAPDAPYAVHTVVEQAVTAAGARRETMAHRGLVNAVLRNLLRRKDALLETVNRDEVARWNYPRWWIATVRAAWPDCWQQVLEAGNARAPLTLRINRRHMSAEAYLEHLHTAGIEAFVMGEQGVRLARAMAVERLPGFASGWFCVQDGAAQMAAPLLGAADGMRVLDACAAPGGKTGHLLELADVQVTALELDAKRAQRIDSNLARLGLRAEIIVGDAANPQWWDARPFERILVDVPCSASGIVRRHADIRWLRREADLAALVAQQRRIVSALWPLLAQGGEMLYVTCSIFPAEGEDQAQWFERNLPDAIRLSAPGQLLPTTAAISVETGLDHDGFFFARFLKR